MRRSSSRFARSLGAVAAALGLASLTLLGAAPANAADLGTVTWDGTTLAPSTLTGANGGDTFSFYNNFHANLDLVNATGTISRNGHVCDGTQQDCAVVMYQTYTFTIGSAGTVQVVDGSTVVATLTLNSGSGGGGVPTVQTLPGHPTNIVAKPGNGAVQLSWSAPATMGAGDFLQYGFNFQETGSLGETYGCKTTSTTCTITGLTNGTPYTFLGYTLSTIGWSTKASVSATPSASTACTTLFVAVTQPTEESQARVTSPVTSSAAPTVYPFIAPPYGGKISAPAIGSWNSSTGTGAAGGEYTTFTPTTDNACPVTVTAPQGTSLATNTGIAFNAGTSSVTVYSGTPVYVFGTKTGTYDIPFTIAGTSLTATPKVRIGTVLQAAYNIALTPDKQDLTTGGFGTQTITVTDYFGNPVAGSTVTASASGQVLLGGYSTSLSTSTNAAGTATVTVIAGVSAGSGTVVATPSPDPTEWAWAATYTKPTQFTAAPMKSATATVNVVAPVTKSIVIVGERTTVSGKSGIRIDGATEGFAEGDIVNPYVKLAGQTEYTMGVDKTVDMAGEFAWQRKTGKKAYVYFKSADGSVKSNTVIIPTA